MVAVYQVEEGREKKRAALLSVGSALLLVSLKAFLVVRTGSLGVLSEALHSGLDLLAAIITFLSVRMSDRPADEKHPYGHGKFENFSAFVETGLLALTAVYIVYEAFDRLFFRSVHIQPSFTAILVLLVALGIDLTRARALSHVAQKYSSEALEADALHFSTDVWSTIVVIAGIGLVWAGETWNLPWLNYADALAGLTVAAVILWVGAQLGRRTLDALLDAAPEGLQQEIAKAVAHMEGVLDVDRVRVRRAGNLHFVDATVSVARTASLEQVHALSDAIEKRIGEIVPADVMVHAEPRAPQGEHLFEAIRELRDGPIEVNIHIEPLGRHIATPDDGAGEMKQLSQAVEQFLNSLPLEFDELLNCHDVRTRQVAHHILVSCHCTMKGTLPITQIHDVTATLGDRVKEKFPQIHRVTIHPEPVEG